MRKKVSKLLKKYEIERDVAIAYSVILTFLLVLLVYLSFQPTEDPEWEALTAEYNDDIIVIFQTDVKEQLDQEYDPHGMEYFFCMMGNVSGDTILINQLVSEPYITRTPDYILYEKDPPCQIQGSVGSVHSHTKRHGCRPSENDIFTFGEMKNPEPVINIIHCDVDKFYIMKMPKQYEAIDWRSLRWTVEE